MIQIFVYHICLSWYKSILFVMFGERLWSWTNYNKTTHIPSGVIIYTDTCSKHKSLLTCTYIFLWNIPINTYRYIRVSKSTVNSRGEQNWPSNCRIGKNIPYMKHGICWLFVFIFLKIPLPGLPSGRVREVIVSSQGPRYTKWR